MKKIADEDYFGGIIDDCVKGIKSALEKADKQKAWKSYHRMRSVLYIAFPDVEEQEEGLVTIR